MLPTGGGDRQIADGSAVNPWHYSIGESICVYLRDLRAMCAGEWKAFVSSCLRVCDVLCVSLCLSDSAVFARLGSQQTGGRTAPECSKLTARLPVVQAMHAGADLMTFSTKTSSGM